MKSKTKSPSGRPACRFLFAAVLAATSALAGSSCGAIAAPDGAAPPALAARTLPRALWVWDARVISNPEQQSALFAFCALKHLSVLYVSMGDAFSATQLDPANPRHVTAPLLANFLGAAHARGLVVQVLDGDPSFALDAKHAEALARLQRALDYNKGAAPAEKLDGFQWDTEPYLLPQWKESTEAANQVLQQYLDGAAQMRDAVLQASPAFHLGYAIPWWFSAPERAVDWKGVSKPPAFHLMDILDTQPAGYVAIMAYRDQAPGPHGSIAISQADVDYAGKSATRVQVWIGQETGDVKGSPASITFWQEGEPGLEAALGQIEAAYRDQPALAGVAIHHWGSYRELGAGHPEPAAADAGPGAATAVAAQANVPVAAPAQTLTITAPAPDAGVDRTMEVSGTAAAGGEGVAVEVAVRPAGDIWYPQGHAKVGADGSWHTTCRFGNANTPAGRVFEVRARLLRADGNSVQEQVVRVSTK